MVKFLSEEWIDIGKKYILEKLDPVKDLKSITTSLLGRRPPVIPNLTTPASPLGPKPGPRQFSPLLLSVD